MASNTASISAVSSATSVGESTAGRTAYPSRSSATAASGGEPTYRPRFLPRRRIMRGPYRPLAGRLAVPCPAMSPSTADGHVPSQPLRRRRHRRRPQRPGRRGTAGQVGKRTVVLERRAIVGGAAVTETTRGGRVQGHDALVRREPAAADDPARPRPRAARLPVYPQGPYFVPYPDGRPLQLPADPRRRRGDRQVLRPDADAIDRGTPGCTGSPTCSVRCSRRSHPSSAAKRPGDLLGRRAGLAAPGSACGVADVTRLFSMSVADLLDDYFESPQMLGVLSVSGVIGTWAGPGRRAPPS